MAGEAEAAARHRQDVLAEQEIDEAEVVAARRPGEEVEGAFGQGELDSGIAQDGGHGTPAALVDAHIHGGPQGQERPDFAWFSMPLIQFLTLRGFAVFVPNVRGSTGYGKTYQKLIHRDWGGGELQDMEHAVEYLHSLDWVDPNRIGFFGGSFGGFACLSCVTRLPDKFAAAHAAFDKALAMPSLTGAQVQEANLRKADLYLARHESQKALEYYNQSLEIVRSIGERRIGTRGIPDVGSLAERGWHPACVGQLRCR